MHFALQVPGGFGRLGCPARAVVGDDLALATCLQKREAITPSNAQPATAASAAVPPERMTSIAATAAIGCDVATIAFWAWTVDRPARWKFLIL